MAKVVMTQGNETMALSEDWDGVFEANTLRYTILQDQYREFKLNCPEVLSTKELARMQVFKILLENKIVLSKDGRYVLTFIGDSYLIIDLDFPEHYISVFGKDYEIIVKSKSKRGKDKCVLAVDKKSKLMLCCFDEVIQFKQKYRRSFLHIKRNAQNNTYLRVLTEDGFFDYKLSHLVMGLSLPPKYSELVLGALNGRGGKSVFEVDHITPICKGGTDSFENLQLLTIEEHLIKTKHERQKRNKEKKLNILKY